jgi:hypothetical protein
MLEQVDHAKTKARALRNAEFAALTGRPTTDQARAVVDEVFRLVIAEEARRGSRQRQRGRARADAFVLRPGFETPG